MRETTAGGRILLVDDEANIREGLAALLQKDGHTVQAVDSAAAALHSQPAFAPEVAVLDIRMPGMSGSDLLVALKAADPHLAVIMLTGHGTLETAITAVQHGAFDYLLKPAHPDALRAVVQRALGATRRAREQTTLIETLRTGLSRLQTLPASPQPESAPDRLTIGALTIDRAAYEVRLADNLLALTPTEYQLLLALAERDGAVLDYVTLARVVLDYEAARWEAKELIKRHIYTLRQKIEPDPANPVYLRNVRGIGYRLVVPA